VNLVEAAKAVLAEDKRLRQLAGRPIPLTPAMQALAALVATEEPQMPKVGDSVEMRSAGKITAITPIEPGELNDWQNELGEHGVNVSAHVELEWEEDQDGPKWCWMMELAWQKDRQIWDVPPG
jgi:hypothetical protein